MFTFAVMLSCAVLSPTVPAPSGAPQMIVRYDDLDLHSAAGAAKLRHRVDEAVRLMARNDLNAPGSFLEKPEIRAARFKARQQADRLVALADATSNTSG